MAKFFRFIVNLCIICFLLTGVALIVPQFVGITTVIVDGDITDTNVSAGSVVYGRTVALNKLEVGDKLLRSSNTSVSVDKITEADSGTGKYTVETGDGETEELTLRGTGEKVLLTVPFVGYASIAMQTLEGRIILGLALAFLVILFILSEIWKSNEEDEEDEDEYEEEASSEEEEQDEKPSRRERKSRKKEDKRRRKLEKKGLLEEEPEEEEQEPQTTDSVEEVPVVEEVEAEELILEPADELEEVHEEVLAAVESLEEPETQVHDEEDAFTAAIQAALESEISQETSRERSEDEMQQSQETEIEEEVQDEVEPETPAEPKKLAIPALTVEELLDKAHASGDDPTVIEDEDDGVSLVDYSDVL